MPRIPTPRIDKARTEELTSSEIGFALRELGMLNGAGSRARIAIADDRRASIAWGYERFGSSHLSVEDALVAEADEILRIVAEEDEDGYPGTRGGDPADLRGFLPRSGGRGMTTFDEIERAARLCVKSAAECFGETAPTFGFYTPLERFALAAEVFLAMPWSSRPEFSALRDLIAGVRAYMAHDVRPETIEGMLDAAQEALARLRADSGQFGVGA